MFIGNGVQCHKTEMTRSNKVHSNGKTSQDAAVQIVTHKTKIGMEKTLEDINLSYVCTFTYSLTRIDKKLCVCMNVCLENCERERERTSFSLV